LRHPVIYDELKQLVSYYDNFNYASHSDDDDKALFETLSKIINHDDFDINYVLVEHDSPYRYITPLYYLILVIPQYSKELELFVFNSIKDDLKLDMELGFKDNTINVLYNTSLTLYSKKGLSEQIVPYFLYHEDTSFSDLFIKEYFDNSFNNMAFHFIEYSRKFKEYREHLDVIPSEKILIYFDKKVTSLKKDIYANEINKIENKIRDSLSILKKLNSDSPHLFDDVIEPLTLSLDNLVDKT